jgi:hypothetical protein
MNGSITKEELLELGVELKGDELDKLVDELNDKIDELVGDEILSSLTPDDIDKLADMQDSATDEDLADWLVNKVPDYPEILENNKDIVLGDYAEGLDDDNE